MSSRLSAEERDDDAARGDDAHGKGPLGGLRRLTASNPVTVFAIVSGIVGVMIASYGVGRDAGQQDLEMAVQDRDRAEAAASEAEERRAEAESELEGQPSEDAEPRDQLSPSPSASAPTEVGIEGAEVLIQLDMGPPYPQRSWDLTRNDVATTGETTDFFIEQRDENVGLIPYRDAGTTASRVEAAGPDAVAVCAARAYTSETLPLEEGAVYCLRVPGQLEALIQVTDLVIVPRPPDGPPPDTATTVNLVVTARPLDQ